MTNKKFKIDYKTVNTAWLALDDYSEQFGTSHENREIEKAYWRQYLERFPEQKADALDLYEDLRYDSRENASDAERKTARYIEYDNDMTEMIEFFKSL